MGGCSAPNCTSRTERHIKMYRFPKEGSYRREKWCTNIRRDQWTCTKNSRLCEKHFEQSQFLNFEKKILNENAIPTLFNFKNAPKKLGPRADGVATQSQQGFCQDHSYCSKIITQHLSLVEENNAGTSTEIVEVEKFTCDECKKNVLENRQLKRKVKELERKLAMMKENLSSFLEQDQIAALSLPIRSKNVQWSAETVKKGLQIRCMTGVQGYELLLKMNFPLPSYRTLTRRVENLTMEPGIQTLALDYMSAKFTTSSEQIKCSLMLDEIQIKPGIEYDITLKKFLGFISPKLSSLSQPENTPANHALVFMVKGIKEKWKQIVAWYFTGNSVPGAKLWDVTKSIIKELSNRNFIVKSIVSDMGPGNQAMWHEAGITSKKLQVEPSCPNPFIENSHIYFFADPPHLLKNFRTTLISNDLILPDDIVKVHMLPTNRVSFKWIEDLVEFQSEKEFKLAPKLNTHHAYPSQFKKMRVGIAAQVLSHSTASALKTLVAIKEFPPEALSTAFVCEFFNNWWDIINSRFMATAIFSNNSQNFDTLEKMNYFIQNIKFQKRSTNYPPCWKPVQSGIKLSTTSAIKIFNEMVVKDQDTKFLMCGRFTQDALENVFSQIRSKGNMHPKPAQFKVALRLISLSQLMNTIPSSSNYDEDDTLHLVDFIKSHPSQLTATTEIPPPAVFDSQAQQDLGSQNAFYYLCGWAVKKCLIKISCNACETYYSTKSKSQLKNNAILTLLKSYTQEKNLDAWVEPTMYLCHPSIDLLRYLQGVENVFKQNSNIIIHSSNPIDFLKQLFHQNNALDIFSNKPTCHSSVVDKIVDTYCKIRMYIYGKTLSGENNQKQYAGKSAARGNII